MDLPDPPSSVAPVADANSVICYCPRAAAVVVVVVVAPLPTTVAAAIADDREVRDTTVGVNNMVCRVVDDE